MLVVGNWCETLANDSCSLSCEKKHLLYMYNKKDILSLSESEFEKGFVVQDQSSDAKRVVNSGVLMKSTHVIIMSTEKDCVAAPNEVGEIWNDG